ncbi:hypothetical protein NXC24_CH01519 [Rhizobium sp. NXC24]|nr:hypothetical protein NXC24_CH01519 [Rhizobium sp. NXC24]
MRRIDKHFVCHVSCAPRRRHAERRRPVARTGWLHSTIAAPDNESRDWLFCDDDDSSQTAAGTSVPRGLFTS